MLWHCSPWGSTLKSSIWGGSARGTTHTLRYTILTDLENVYLYKKIPLAHAFIMSQYWEFIVKKGTLLVIFMWCLHLINEMEQSKCVCVWNIRSFLWKHEMTDFPFIYLGLCNPYTWRLKTAPLLGEVPPGHLQSCPVLGNGRKGTYYMTNSVSGQDEPNLVLWLATWAGSMELYCPLRIRALSRKENLS